jgi:hypothetical protein
MLPIRWFPPTTSISVPVHTAPAPPRPPKGPGGIEIQPDAIGAVVAVLVVDVFAAAEGDDESVALHPAPARATANAATPIRENLCISPRSTTAPPVVSLTSMGRRTEP